MSLILFIRGKREYKSHMNQVVVIFFSTLRAEPSYSPPEVLLQGIFSRPPRLKKIIYKKKTQKTKQNNEQRKKKKRTTKKTPTDLACISRETPNLYLLSISRFLLLFFSFIFSLFHCYFNIFFCIFVKTPLTTASYNSESSFYFVLCNQ